MPVVWPWASRSRSAQLPMSAGAAPVLAQAGDGILLLDAQGQGEAVNPAADRLFTCGESGGLGQPLSLRMPERYGGTHPTELERLRSGAEPRIPGKAAELHSLTRDGREFLLEPSLATWQVGTEPFCTRIDRDIPERKRMETLQDAHEALRVLLQASPLAITALEWAGRVPLENLADERTLGWREAEIMGYPPPHRPCREAGGAFRAVRQRVLQGEVWPIPRAPRYRWPCCFHRSEGLATRDGPR